MRAERGSLADRTHRLTTRMRGWGECGGPVRAQVNDLDNLRSKNCRHILILVHGFNNTTSEATASYELHLELLNEHFSQSRVAPDAIVFFHWPGNFGWVGFAGYPIDIGRAKESAARLAQYLVDFPRPSDPGAFKITMIGHSLGCRLILEMLKILENGPPLNVEIVSLMAPAVPGELVDEGGDLASTVATPRQILKCHSHHDTVLAFAFPLGQLTAYRIGTENQLYQEALGLYGYPFIVGRPVLTTNRHGDYWDDDDVAGQYRVQIDPTWPNPPPERKLPSRTLPQTSQF
jgi:pimeloyl-ACP methyl ester carboxylesterase